MSDHTYNVTPAWTIVEYTRIPNLELSLHHLLLTIIIPIKLKILLNTELANITLLEIIDIINWK